MSDWHYWCKRAKTYLIILSDSILPDPLLVILYVVLHLLREQPYCV